MSSNTQLSAAVGSGDVIRDVDKSGVKTQVVILDAGGGGAEALLTAGQGTMAASIPVAIASNQSAVPVTGAFWQATQPVSAANLPLPSGAATEAKQDTGNTSLASIDGKITAVNTGAVVVSASALPAGAATSVNQATANTSLTSIDGKAPALGQALAAASVPVVLTAAQLTTLTPPAAITGFATSAKQDTGNTSLASVDGKLPSLGQALAAASVPVVLTAAQLSTLTPLSTVAVTGTFWQATQPVSGTVSITANSAVNVAQVNGVTPLMGNGASGTGAQRVTLASDSTGVLATVSTVTNLSQMGGVAIALNTGVRAAGVQRVTICTDDVVPASQSGTWTVLPGNTPNTTPWLVTPAPATSGGPTVARVKAAGSTNATSVKASAGQVYGWYLYNNTASAKFFKLYNKASSPTVGSDTPLFTVGIPANGGTNIEFGMGVPFGTGVAYAITTGIADSDTGATTAEDVHGVLLYK